MPKPNATVIPRAVPAERRNGMPERRDYVYRGTGTDTLTPELGDPWDDAQQATDTGACHCDGSMRAYRRHLADGEEPCQASRDEANLYQSTRRQAKREATP